MDQGIPSHPDGAQCDNTVIVTKSSITDVTKSLDQALIIAVLIMKCSLESFLDM